MARKKAAIQMSLGLIVAVVFAVVLLTLAITWIQGMIGDITGITKDLTQQAQTKLQDTFAETNTNFAVWPTDYSLNTGETVKLLAGIKNNAPDSQSHDFVINIIPSGASYSVCPEQDVSLCQHSSGISLGEFMTRWATVDRTTLPIEVQSTQYRSITIQVPTQGVASGTYIFNVLACYDRTETGSIVTPSSLECMSDSDNIWSNAASLTIQVG